MTTDILASLSFIMMAVLLMGYAITKHKNAPLIVEIADDSEDEEIRIAPRITDLESISDEKSVKLLEDESTS